MSYKLRYSKSALKDVRKLDIVMRKRLKKKLEPYRGNPERFSKKLAKSKLGQYRFRIGDLRVIFDLEDGWITVLRVGFRGDIYR